jgi:hypothetical protein
MADPEEPLRQDGGPPDGRSRRPPPTIDVKAVAMPPGGALGAAAGDTAWKDWAMRSAVAVSIFVIVAIGAGIFWVYGTPGRLQSQEHDSIVSETAKLDDILGRLAKLESALGAAPVEVSADPAVASRVAALESAVAPLAERVAALERAVHENAAAVRGAVERANAAAGLVEDSNKSSANRNSLVQHDQSALDGLTNRLNVLEGLQAALKSRQEEFESSVNAPPAAAPDKAVRVAVIAAALRTAVERDYPFTAELAVARALGLDEKALAMLEPFAITGVPTQTELFRDLSALVPDLLKASMPAGHDGYLDRLQANATKMMNIHPVGDVQGDEPGTVIGRIELKMVRQDVAGVMAELDRLPAAAKELAQPWRKRALARQAAVQSARRIAAASFAKLGDPPESEPLPR